MASEPRVICQGLWHPPRSSRAEPASLLADGSDVSVRLSEGSPAVAGNHLADLDVSQRIGRIPRRIVFSDGSMFATEDNDAVDAFLSGKRANRSGWVHELERVRPRLIAFALVTILLIAGIWRYALPVMVEVAVAITPPIVPTLMSQGTLNSLDQSVLSESTLPEARRKALQEGFAKLASLAERGKGGYTLNFRDGGLIGPNAFALPDGTLVLTDQLVALAGNDDQMILGVLAHEIGHVDKDHSLRQLYRVAGMTGLIMLIAGDVGSGVEDVMTNGAALLSLSYSREAESQADRYSVELMLKAGLDPVAIGRFFKLLSDTMGDKGSTSMLSTHPGTPERKKAVEDYATLLKQKQAADP